MRVLLADDQAWLRSAVRLLLEQEQDIEIVGEAAESSVLLSITKAVHPDVLLLDWELPGVHSSCGELVLRRLRTTCPEVITIVMSGRPEAGPIALEAGADRFVSKADPPEALLSAIRDIQRSMSLAKSE